MGNPGSFAGTRKTFLDAQKDAYAAAVVGSYIGDYVADVQRRYFKRYPLELDHTTEPTTEAMAAVDDDAPSPEPVAPNEETMAPDEFKDAQKAWEARKILLKLRKGVSHVVSSQNLQSLTHQTLQQIQRRLAYVHAKEHMGKKAKAQASDEDPMTVLTAKLTNTSSTKPRQPIPYYLWAAANSDIVDKAFEQERERQKPEKKKLVNLRSTLIRKLFLELPEDVQKEWEAKAKEEHASTLLARKEKLEGPASTAPEDRQRYVHFSSNVHIGL